MIMTPEVNKNPVDHDPSTPTFVLSVGSVEIKFSVIYSMILLMKPEGVILRDITNASVNFG